MRRRVVAAPGFEESAAALGDAPEVSLVLEALVARARARPEAAPALPGHGMRVIRSRSYGDYPALRLVYRLVRDVVHLLDVSFRDELTG